MDRKTNTPARLLLSVAVSLSAALWWSEGKDIVPVRAQTVGGVSIHAVPVGFSEPVLGCHPNVQDLGVSTWHCQSEERQEKHI